MTVPSLVPTTPLLVAAPNSKSALHLVAIRRVPCNLLPLTRIPKPQLRMVQIQSRWFPLYDRNPQTFVPNIFFARPEDYVKATQHVYHAAGAACFIDQPAVRGPQNQPPCRSR
jgi:hypothetical protein